MKGKLTYRRFEEINYLKNMFVQESDFLYYF